MKSWILIGTMLAAAVIFLGFQLASSSGLAVTNQNNSEAQTEIIKYEFSDFGEIMNQFEDWDGDIAMGDIDGDGDEDVAFVGVVRHKMDLKGRRALIIFESKVLQKNKEVANK